MFLCSTEYQSRAFSTPLHPGQHKSSGTHGKAVKVPGEKEKNLMGQTVNITGNLIQSTLTPWTEVRNASSSLTHSLLPPLTLLSLGFSLLGYWQGFERSGKTLSHWDELQYDYNRLSDLQFRETFITLCALRNHKWHTEREYILLLLLDT